MTPSFTADFNLLTLYWHSTSGHYFVRIHLRWWSVTKMCDSLDLLHWRHGWPLEHFALLRRHDTHLWAHSTARIDQALGHAHAGFSSTASTLIATTLPSLSRVSSSSVADAILNKGQNVHFKPVWRYMTIRTLACMHIAGYADNLRGWDARYCEAPPVSEEFRRRRSTNAGRR